MSFLPAADEEYVRKLARCQVPRGDIAVLMDVDEETIERIIAAGIQAQPRDDTRPQE